MANDSDLECSNKNVLKKLIKKSSSDDEFNDASEPLKNCTNRQYKNEDTDKKKKKIKLNRDFPSFETLNVTSYSNFETSEAGSTENLFEEKQIKKERVSVTRSDIDIKPYNSAARNLNRSYPEYKSRSLSNIRLLNKDHKYQNRFSLGSLDISREALPHYRNYQLIGDSQLLRFSEQLLNCKKYVSYTETGSRRIGYCVSGQTIGELETRLLQKKYKIWNNVIMLIGTNDLLRNASLHSSCTSFKSILKILEKEGVAHTVILTVPPIPRLANNALHWAKLKKLNDFILTNAQDGKVFVLDLASLYISYDNTVSLEYFEKTMFSSKKDLIHLNKEGFQFLQFLLKTKYFDKIC